MIQEKNIKYQQTELLESTFGIAIHQEHQKIATLQIKNQDLEALIIVILRQNIQK